MKRKAKKKEVWRITISESTNKGRKSFARHYYLLSAVLSSFKRYCESYKKEKLYYLPQTGITWSRSNLTLKRVGTRSGFAGYKLFTHYTPDTGFTYINESLWFPKELPR